MKGNTLNLSTATVPELKAAAKSAGIKGYSTMKKADLLEALTPVEKAKPESFIDGIKAAMRNARESRSNKGREASRNSSVTLKTPSVNKALAFRLQRGSQSARLTPAQARRVRKTMLAELKFNN
jgi:hypothetical protein